MAIAGLYKIFNHWSEEGTLYIYSDPHFNDPDLKKGIDRPSADELVQKINSKVGRKDTIVILGDICDIEYVKKIRGYKVLLMGNHDAGRTNYERQVITQLFSKELYTKEQVLDLMKTMYPNCRYTIDEGYQFHSPFEFWKVSADNQLFDEVYEGPLMIGEKLILSHEPVDVTWAFNIHGHNHSGKSVGKRHMNVCADVIGYVPVNMNQFMKSGAMAHVETIHRDTIDKATERKRKRGGSIAEMKGRTHKIPKATRREKCESHV